MPSPIPGARSTTVVSAARATSTSLWPTPTVSTRTTSKPAASRTRSACGAAHANPPRWPREAIERMNTPVSVACSDIRTRSPRSAPPENGEDGSMASTPTRFPSRRSAVTSAEVVVDFPTPGGPVIPTTCALPQCGASSAIAERRSGDSSSTRLISRPTARALPARACSTSSAADSGRRHPHDQGVALAAAAAERRRTDATAAALELQGEVQGDPGTGHADRVAEGDRAAVDVDLRVLDAELTRRRDADRGEGLVELDQVEIGRLDAFLRARLDGRRCRLQLQRRVGAGHLAVRTDLGEPGQPELLGLGLAHHHDRGRAVGDLRGRTGRDRAFFAECRTELPEALGGRVAADALVDRDHDRVTLALRDLDRHDLVVEDAVLPGDRCLLVRLRGELVLLIASQVLRSGVALLGEQAHR